MSQKKKILVTGANGQLGQSLYQYIPPESHEFVLTNKNQLDITKPEQIQAFFDNNHFDYCLNLAAYTNVEKAESEPEDAFLINAKAPSSLARICSKNKCTLIHISTDYVFDGKRKMPYLETDLPNPINIYGKSKWEGEKNIVEQADHYYIIRTSWLYSNKGNNFYNTILRLSKEKKELKIVSDQTGTPTLTYDLIDFIFWLMQKKPEYGIYHFSNEGETSWYDFAKKIVELHGLPVEVLPVFSNEFHTKAKRPTYSVLSKSKIKKLSYIPRKWDEALYSFIKTK